MNGMKFSLGVQPKRKDAVENFQETSVSIANMPAKQIAYVQEVQGDKVKYKGVLLEKEGVIEIMFFSKNETALADFDKVVESITVTKN